MSRYRKRQAVGDNLRDLYSHFQQWISSGLGDSSIDWDDDGDDGSSLDLTVSDSTVAKYGHDGSRHGFLVPNGSGWRTVQEDAQAKADVAEADAKAYTDSKDAATRSWADGRLDALSDQIDEMGDTISSLASAIGRLQDRVSALESRLGM